MAAKTDDLWPTEIGPDDRLIPLEILREQGEILGRRTNNLLVGEVRTDPEIDNFRHRFYIKADALGGYRYLLLEVTHGPVPYPAQVFFGDQIERPTRHESFATLLNYNGGQVCSTPEQFQDILRQIFNTDTTRKVISSLLQQSKIAA